MKGFKIVDLKDFLGKEEIPAFDPTIKWRQMPDRPPRRRLRSHGYMDTEEPYGRQNSDAEQVENQNPLIRQRSTEKDTEMSKRSKTTALIEVDDAGNFETSMGRCNISDIQWNYTHLVTS